MVQLLILQLLLLSISVFFFQVAGLLDLCVCLLIAEKQFATHKMYTKHINKTYTSYKTSALC